MALPKAISFSEWEMWAKFQCKSLPLDRHLLFPGRDQPLVFLFICFFFYAILLCCILAPDTSSQVQYLKLYWNIHSRAVAWICYFSWLDWSLWGHFSPSAFPCPVHQPWAALKIITFRTWISDCIPGDHSVLHMACNLYKQNNFKRHWNEIWSIRKCLGLSWEPE